MPVKPWNIVRLFPDAVGFLNGIIRQKRFIKKNILPVIEQFKSLNDGSLSSVDIKKMFLYYGLAVPAITGEMFCRMRNSPMTNRERTATTCLGLLTGLFDDFFDTHNLSEKEIFQRIGNSTEMKAVSTADKVFQCFLKMTLDNIPPNCPVESATRLMVEAQQESRRQKTAVLLSRDELEYITRLKGGYAVIFLRYAFGHNLVQGEYEALRSAGAVFQYGNDIFDVYNDLQSEIQTLPNTAESVEQIKHEFENLLSETFILFHKLPYSVSAINRALILIYVIAGRCFVCLEQYEQIQKAAGNKWEPSLFKRSELICDMEKPLNMLRSIRFYLENA